MFELGTAIGIDDFDTLMTALKWSEYDMNWIVWNDLGKEMYSFENGNVHSCSYHYAPSLKRLISNPSCSRPHPSIFAIRIEYDAKKETPCS